MHALVAFAKPFRMPDFFLISGLFLARVIDRDWRTYLDRKVVHFVYFYVLWVTIQFVFKAPAFAAEGRRDEVVQLYLESFIEPFGTLWFIYLLPIFFVVTKLTRSVPVAVMLWLVGARARDRADRHRLDRDRRVRRAASSISTPAMCSRRASSRFADVVQRRCRGGAGRACRLGGAQRRAGVRRLSANCRSCRSALGFVGAAAVVAVSALLAQAATGRSRCAIAARHSIVIYLAFFLPMAATPHAAAQDRDHSRSSARSR